jgi:hypothetical protein
MEPCKLATQYAVKIQATKSLCDLENVGKLIKSDVKNLEGYVEWLRDIYTSHKDYYINAKEFDPNNLLNKEGLKLWNEGKL